MAYTLWLSAEEEQVLDRIMRHEGARTKEQAAIRAILSMGDRLDSERPDSELPVTAAAALPGQSMARQR